MPWHRRAGRTVASPFFHRKCLINGVSWVRESRWVEGRRLLLYMLIPSTSCIPLDPSRHWNSSVVIAPLRGFAKFMMKHDDDNASSKKGGPELPSPSPPFHPWVLAIGLTLI